MRFGIAGWMLLLWSFTLVNGAPCRSFLTIGECQANTNSSTTSSSIQCFWCEATSTCGSDMTQCNSEPIVGATNETVTCQSLPSEGECTALTGCVWCSDIELCSASGDECDNFVESEGCSNENCTEGDSGVAQTTVCDDANCTDAEDGDGGDEDAEDGDAGDGDATSGNNRTSEDQQNDGGQVTENNTACRSLETEANCTMVENCLWCSDQAQCRQEAIGCPGSGGGSDREDHDRNNCFPIRNETECAETGMCFWCPEQDVCRPNFGSCPGNDGISSKPNLCHPLRNETDCLDSESCFWCEDSSLCRASEEACPGRGRNNICRDLPQSVCDLAEGCRWWQQQDRCGPHRGVPTDRGNSTDDETSACPLLNDEGNCTMQFQCRWCSEDEKCQSALDLCADGTLGTRGNPCQQATIEDVCTDIIGCLWCAESSKCKKATIQGCDLNDGDFGNGTLGNFCIVHDLQVDCEEIDECQWCEAQSKCKRNQTECGDPSGYVDLAFDERDGPRFQIRDDGLGPTDPYAVEVTLNYLYEVTEAGTTIEASLVDLESQVYKVKQTVGYFFGDSIEARRIHFETTIDGVGTIVLDAYVILNDGNITTPGTESWVVAKGDVKFNVELSNWTFCGDATPCGESNETSSYVDLAFSIRGDSETPQESDDNALVFNLGGNVPLLLSNEVVVDAFMQDMPDGFPRAESTTSQGTVFMFRFPRFREGVSYDPIIPYHYSLSVLKSEIDPTIPPMVAVPTSVPRPPTAPPTLAPIAPLPKSLPSDDDDNGGLSGGAIAGIVIGSLLGLCCCCAGIGYAASRKKGDDNGYHQASDSDEKNNVTMDGDDFEDEADGHHRRKDEEEGSPGSESDEDEDDEDDEDDDEDKHNQGYSSSSGESDISTSDSE